MREGREAWEGGGQGGGTGEGGGREWKEDRGSLRGRRGKGGGGWNTAWGARESTGGAGDTGACMGASRGRRGKRKRKAETHGHIEGAGAR